MIRRLIAAALLVAACCSLTSCRTAADEDRDRYRLCLEHGGDYRASDNGVGYSCTLPPRDTP